MHSVRIPILSGVSRVALEARLSLGLGSAGEGVSPLTARGGTFSTSHLELGKQREGRCREAFLHTLSLCFVPRHGNVAWCQAWLLTLALFRHGVHVQERILFLHIAFGFHGRTWGYTQYSHSDPLAFLTR